MDNFMYNPEEKISAQDIIRANAQAETAESERIKQEAEQYRLQLEEIKETNRQYKEKLDEFKNEIDNVSKKIDESDSRIHDVGVQVYRNVQAVIDKNSEKTNAELEQLNSRLETVLSAAGHKNKGFMPLLVITIIIALADLVLNILIYLGII